MYKYPTTKRTHSWDNTNNEHKLLFALAIGELLSVQMKNTADAKPWEHWFSGVQQLTGKGSKIGV